MYLVVWETLKPKYSPYSAISFFITVDLPDPLGPHSTRGRGGAAAAGHLTSSCLIVTKVSRKIRGTQYFEKVFTR